MRAREKTRTTLLAMGMNHAQANTIMRISATLSTWDTHITNGTIARDEKTGKCSWRVTGRPTKDRETNAMKRAEFIAKQYGRLAYHQDDARGPSLYLLERSALKPGDNLDAVYASGFAVVA